MSPTSPTSPATTDEHQAGGAGGSSVAAMTREAMGRLTNAERKAARALLSAYPVAGLETVAELAERAGVSAPTVVRFVSRLGFSGYAAFQRALMHEVHARMGSPLEQYAEKRAVPSGEELLPYVASTFVDSLHSSFDGIPTSDFEHAVELLCSARVRVHVVGGRFSHVLAEYLVAHLQLLRAGVRTVPGDEFSRVSLVGDVTKDDLLVAFDFRRYDPSTVRLAQEAARGGAKILLLTDPFLSPISAVSDTVLPTRVDSPSPFDSLVPAFALVEALVAAVTDRLGDRGRSRVERLEGLRERLDPHTPSALPPPVP
ncbi:MurR/RpiR family transcriptional regulator [Ornithinimicrobium sufpigmenti]|uniref:MurR/RpiR family transcriptional regulator n=1 Tax=Ornithinimicrobium sufpigmenti TaxID=2508882 RepID=UPI0010358F74|nr:MULTISPECIES: MurR/RpiR family transcriptional regulator [unclassified Ornithinimicrobium]